MKYQWSDVCVVDKRMNIRFPSDGAYNEQSEFFIGSHSHSQGEAGIKDGLIIDMD